MSTIQIQEQKLRNLETHNIQFLVDEVSRLLGEKTKYVAVFDKRLKVSWARAYVHKFIRNGRRIIEFNYYAINDKWLHFNHHKIMIRKQLPNEDITSYFRDMIDYEKTFKTNREEVILTIIHEITHFKQVEKLRKKMNKDKSYSQYVKIMRNLRYKHWHDMKFYRKLNKLKSKLSPENLTYLINLDLSKTQMR